MISSLSVHKAMSHQEDKTTQIELISVDQYSRPSVFLSDILQFVYLFLEIVVRYQAVST